jgi:hypothetical protein
MTSLPYLPDRMAYSFSQKTGKVLVVNDVGLRIIENLVEQHGEQKVEAVWQAWIKFRVFAGLRWPLTAFDREFYSALAIAETTSGNNGVGNER